MENMDRVYAPSSVGLTRTVVSVWGPINMKSLRLPLAAIFFMTNFYRTGGGGMARLAPVDPLLSFKPVLLLNLLPTDYTEDQDEQS